MGGIGVMNTMAMSVIERIREIGIMRAVGWRRRRIALLILSEATGIGLLALALGLLLRYLAAEAFTSRGSISTLAEPDFTAGVFAWGLAFALGVALIGALYPAWRAVSLRPIEALRRSSLLDAPVADAQRPVGGAGHHVVVRDEHDRRHRAPREGEAAVRRSAPVESRARPSARRRAAASDRW